MWYLLHVPLLAPWFLANLCMWHTLCYELDARGVVVPFAAGVRFVLFSKVLSPAVRRTHCLFIGTGISFPGVKGGGILKLTAPSIADVKCRCGSTLSRAFMRWTGIILTLPSVGFSFSTCNNNTGIRQDVFGGCCALQLPSPTLVHYMQLHRVYT